MVAFARCCCGRADAILDLGDGRARHEHLGLRAAAGAVSGFGSVDLQGRLVALPLQQRHHLFLVIAVEPGQCRVAPEVGEFERVRRLRDFAFAFEARGAGATFVRARHGLHHADRAHGHEIVREAVAIRAIDGKVFHRQAQHRVGQLARGDGHFAGRGGRRILGGQCVRSDFRRVQRFIEGKGSVGKCGGRGGPAREAEGQGGDG